MSMTTITFRKNKELKESATAVFEAEMLTSKDMTHTYPTGFFDLFGSGKDLGFDEEPEELSFENKEIQL